MGVPHATHSRKVITNIARIHCFTEYLLRKLRWWGRFRVHVYLNDWFQLFGENADGWKDHCPEIQKKKKMLLKVAFVKTENHEMIQKPLERASKSVFVTWILNIQIWILYEGGWILKLSFGYQILFWILLKKNLDTKNQSGYLNFSLNSGKKTCKFYL